VPLVETPADLAQLARQLSNPDQAAQQRRAIEALAAHSPQLADLVAMVRDALRKADGRLATRSPGGQTSGSGYGAAGGPPAM